MNLDVMGELNLTIDDLIGIQVAVLGIRGSGKSHTARVLCEELLPHLPMTIVDIDGEYYTLKEQFPALEVYGGGHGNDLIDPEVLFEHSFGRGVSVVLDFSNTKAQAMFDYLLRYFEALWARTSPEAARKPYGVLLEEAHKFIPQSKATPLSDVINDFAGRGRKRGITTLLVSQRSQKVNKDTLTASELYFLHEVIHPNDLATYQRLIPRPPARVLELVSGLTTGQAIVRHGKSVQVVTIRPAQTRHAGATPTLKRVDSDEVPESVARVTPETPVQNAVMIREAEGSVTVNVMQNDDSLQPPTGKGCIPWMDGVKIAWEMIALLADVCERIAVAGSLRRGKPMVGDVEIVAMPGKANVEAFERRCQVLLERGRFQYRFDKNGRRLAFSPRMKLVYFRGVPLDLFIVLPDRQWGPTFLIRTGPSDANEALVTARGIRNRNGHPGVLPPGMKFDAGQVWRDGVALDVPEEWDVLKACGLPWVSPARRSAETYRSAAQTAKGQRLLPGDEPPCDWNYVKFNGRWYHMDVPLLLTGRPELADELASLQAEAVPEVVEQIELFR